ncbi:MAG: sugar nucleotide-binding protein [Halieaceae bacterium]
MRVLVIGADTPVGQALGDYLALRGTDFVGLPKADCRWKSERQAKKSLRRSECDLAIDTRLAAAADGGIRVHDIDVERCLWLARACQTVKLPLLLLSCSRVFQGDESRAYREEDYPDGSSTIASLLIAAEAAVRDNCERHVILRTGPVFAATGINVITHMLGQLQQSGKLELSRRRCGCPISAEDAARVVSGMVDQFACGLESWGIYHYCSIDMTNCYEFAEVLLASASQYENFDPQGAQLLALEDEGDLVEYSLDCSKIRDTFAIKQQPWRASVAGYVKQYYADNAAGEDGGGESYRHSDASA